MMETGGVRNGVSSNASLLAHGCRIVAAGLNAHSQIQENGGRDLRSFTPSIDGDQKSGAVRILFAGWSSTVFVRNTQLSGTGFQRFSQTLAPRVAETLIDGFGDHNRMIGCLDTAGNLYLLSESGDLVEHSTESSPKIGHIAIAGNGILALSFKQAPNGRLCHILQFGTFGEFKTWFDDPSGVKIEPEKQHFMMQGRPMQLVANTGTFMVLMEDGEVYTWGDPRYQSLGRKIADTPAHRPGVLDALGGLRIVKVAAGGWMSAALSEDRAAYVWGAGEPGKDSTLKLLREADAGNVVLISIPSSGGSEAEPLDMIDIAVGDNHIAVLAESGRLFVAGDNRTGQLGIDSDEAWVDDWVEVPNANFGGNFCGVVCGPKATLLSVDTRHHIP